MKDSWSLEINWPKTVKRFWSQVDRPREGCWNFVGKNGQGHTNGKFRVCKNPSVIKTPCRFAYELFHGPLRQEKAVRQKCGNPRCVHPFHLYAELRDARRKRRLEKAKRAAQEWAQFKNSLVCSRCGWNEAGVGIEFHHRDPSEKDFELGKKGRHFGPENARIQEELAKCDVLCSNCHKLAHGAPEIFKNFRGRTVAQ